MITIPNKKNMPTTWSQNHQTQSFQISHFMKSLMLIPRRYVLIHKFLLTFPIQRWDIKHLIPLLIPCMECMFHLEDINLQTRLDNEHWNDLAQWYGHPHFYLWSHFGLVHNFSTIQFCLVLDCLYSICISHALKQTNRRML